jgi:hydroxymethylpyrimidine pyrophosphatase-like HAD family hydrolase
LQFGIITASGISKKQGAIDISQSTKIGLDYTLGVGDSLSDWQFIELCGYQAAMGNANNDLKSLVQKTNPRRSFISPSVNRNGVIDIFRHFQLF